MPPSDPTPPRSIAPSSEEREAVISALGDAYAADTLALDDLEQRMARVYRATTREALAEVLADLHPSRPWAGGGSPAASTDRPRPPGRPWPDTLWTGDRRLGPVADPLSPRAREYGVATIARPEIVPAREAIVALVGASERKGAWVVPRQVRVVSVMGGVDLDLREAQFGEGVTEIEVFALMGGVEICVPTGVRVEATGMGILGGFGITGADADPGPNAPVLRISGVALMGGVDAKLKKIKRRSGT
jgi:hypothetical protein